MTVREPNNSSRVEREILEILEKADASITPIDRFSSNLRRRPHVARPNPSISQKLTGKVTPEVIKIAASLVLALLAAVVAGASHLLGLGFAIASLIVLFSLWIPSKSAGLGDRPRWRGRDLGSSPRLPGWNGGSVPPRKGPRQPQR
jgi:hypothetical protein